MPDLLVPRLCSHGAVDNRQPIDITHGDPCRRRKGILSFLHKTLETFPFLETGEKICFQCCIGKYKQLSQMLSFFILQSANVTSERPFFFTVLYIKLKRTAFVFLQMEFQLIVLQEILQSDPILFLHLSKQIFCSFFIIWASASSFFNNSSRTTATMV